MIKVIARFINALNGNVKKSQLAAGFAWGLLLALIPVGNIFWIALFLISFFFRHNYWAKIIFMVVGIILTPLFAPLMDAIGWSVLHIAGLQPFFTEMYNTPFVPFTKFNNTLVAGGLVSGVIIWLPAFFAFMGLITVYRKYLAFKLRDTKFARVLAKIPLFSSINKAMKKG